MNSNILKELLQSRMNLQLSIFFKATLDNDELTKEKTKSVIKEIQSIAKSFDIELSSSIAGYFDGKEPININFDK